MIAFWLIISSVFLIKVIFFTFKFYVKLIATCRAAKEQKKAKTVEKKSKVAPSKQKAKPAQKQQKAAPRVGGKR